MSKKMLLFGFEDLPTIAAVDGIAKAAGAEMVLVRRSDYNQRIGALAGLKALSRQAVEYVGGPLGGRMIVFCDLEGQLESILDALNRASVTSLKAVLTQYNRDWTPVQLYGELMKENQALRQGRSAH